VLVPVQTSGKKPPLFFVHGLHGVMWLGATFARALGPDQPLYVIRANGIDGRRPVMDNLDDMVRAYVEDIHGARPIGPLRIGGMCQGSVAAIEIARALRDKGRQVGPVILTDPGVYPSARWRDFAKEDAAIDARDPQIARRLYEQVRSHLLDHVSQPFNDRPFDPGDPAQLHLATLAGVASIVAFTRHTPMSFAGPTEVVLSTSGATGFFHPEVPWPKILPGPRAVVVLPFEHTQLLRAGREHLARAVKFLIDEGPELERAAQQQFVPAFA
jgi:thioesterase domain-containing protein